MVEWYKDRECEVFNRSQKPIQVTTKSGREIKIAPRKRKTAEFDAEEIRRLQGLDRQGVINLTILKEDSDDDENEDN